MEKTGNELIAEFMGYKQWDEQNDLAWYEGSYLKYDKHPILTKEQYYSQFMWDVDAKSYQPTKKIDLKYDCDWNWLMPVVEKIEEVNSVKTQGCYFPFDTIIKTDSCTILGDDEDIKYGGKQISFRATGQTKKEAVYKTVVEFIKWYNSQSPSLVSQKQ